MRVMVYGQVVKFALCTAVDFNPWRDRFMPGSSRKSYNTICRPVFVANVSLRTFNVWHVGGAFCMGAYVARVDGSLFLRDLALRGS